MELFKRLLLGFFILFSLSSCQTFNASLDSLLISPKAPTLIIEGTFEMSDFYYMYSENSKGRIPKGSYLFLNSEYLRINDLLFNIDKFKVKVSMLGDYMRVRFNIDDLTFLNLEDKEVYILTIQDKNKLTYEFIKYDGESILFHYNDDIMYKFKKISNKIDESLEEYVKNNYKNNVLNESKDIVNTGFLISLRSERKLDGSIPRSSYKTFWFYQSLDGTYKTKSFDNIIMPKGEEILEIKVKESDKNPLYEKIVINNMENMRSLNMNEEFINQFIDITYVNENYIGISYDQSTDYLGKVETDKWGMLSIKDPSIERRLSFSDIFIKNEESYYKSHKKFLDLIKNSDVLEFYDLEPREDSFSLRRYGGNWFLKGRINEKKEGITNGPLDFDIEVLPKHDLVRNNNSNINLAEFKAKDSEIVDGFLSPNKDLIFFITKNSIKVFKVISGKVSSNILFEYEIEENDEVISSNFYIGDEGEYINSLLLEYN